MPYEKVLWLVRRGTERQARVHPSAGAAVVIGRAPLGLPEWFIHPVAELDDSATSAHSLNDTLEDNAHRALCVP
jgi:hypothetical protein